MFRGVFSGTGALSNLEEQIKQLLNQFRQSVEPGAGPEGLGRWTPRLDIAETDEAFLVLADLPGVKAEELSISINDGVLSLEGERKPDVTKSVKSVYQQERPFGTFSRSVSLPGIVDIDHVTAEAKDGVLRITLPKKAEARPRQVSIKVK